MVVITTYEPKVYTVAEVQNILRLGRSSIYEAIARGDIPTIRIGKRLLIPKTAIDQLLSPQSSEK